MGYAGELTEEEFDLESLVGKTVDKVCQDGDSDIWLHLDDGTAVEITAEDGGFVVYIYGPDKPTWPIHRMH